MPVTRRNTLLTSSVYSPSSEHKYVKQLQELVDIYVKPSAACVRTFLGVTSREEIDPFVERGFVFNGIESLLVFHKDTFLPDIESMQGYRVLVGGVDKNCQHQCCYCQQGRGSVRTLFGLHEDVFDLCSVSRFAYKHLTPTNSMFTVT